MATKKAGAPRKKRVDAASVHSLNDRYNDLVGSLDLLSIRLARSHVDAHVVYVPKPELDLVPAVSTSAEYLTISSGFAVDATVRFEGAFTESESPAIVIEAELELVYLSKVEMTDELFEVFEQVNLPLNTWPFFREFLHSTLARTGWPIYTLPAYRSREFTQMRATAESDIAPRPLSD